MNKFTNPLENIRIASPCKADWNEMIGDERQRFCGECKLNVYNLSGMKREEAENLLLKSEGRVCVRFYKRADGTILTKDCPIGWQAFKRRVSKTTAAFVSLLFGIISGLGLTAIFNKQSKIETTMGTITYSPTPRTAATPENTPLPLMGAIAIKTPTPKATPEELTMGEVYIPTPKPTPKPKNIQVLIGKVMAQEN